MLAQQPAPVRGGSSSLRSGATDGGGAGRGSLVIKGLDTTDDRLMDKLCLEATSNEPSHSEGAGQVYASFFSDKFSRTFFLPSNDCSFACIITHAKFSGLRPFLKGRCRSPTRIIIDYRFADGRFLTSPRGMAVSNTRHVNFQ